MCNYPGRPHVAVANWPCTYVFSATALVDCAADVTFWRGGQGCKAGRQQFPFRSTSCSFSTLILLVGSSDL